MLERLSDDVLATLYALLPRPAERSLQLVARRFRASRRVRSVTLTAPAVPSDPHPWATATALRLGWAAPPPTEAFLCQLAGLCPNVEDLTCGAALVPAAVWDGSPGPAALPALFPRLRRLALTGGPVSVEALPPALESLECDGACLSAERLRALAARCPALTRLSVTNGGPERGRPAALNGAALSALPASLRALDVADCWHLPPEAVFATASRLSALRSLAMTGTSPWPPASGAYPTQLEELTLYEASLVAPSDPAALRAALPPGLRSLTLVNCTPLEDPIAAAAAAGVALERLTALRLDLAPADGGWAHDLGPALAAVGRHCPALTALDVSLSHAAFSPFLLVDDAGVEAVARGCPQLARLDVACCTRLTVDAFAAVADGLHRLEHLGADGTVLAGPALAAVVRGCPRLRSLRLAGCDVDDADLAGVAAGLPRLARLGLAGCSRVTDAAVVALAAACPDLEWLQVKWSRVDPAAAARLLPFCQIEP